VTQPKLIRAAGCLVWRYGSREPEVLLVHRPRLDDWSFPKGKLDRRESAPAAAVREVQEETGLRVKLGIPLPDQHYLVRRNVPKVVHYWAATPPADANVTSYEPNHEIDRVRWFRVSKARRKLTYLHDAELLDTFAAMAFDSRPLVILRHAHARHRKTWRSDDEDRPLRAEGIRQSDRLVPLLSAYGMKRVLTSDAERCVDTVLPFVNSGRIRLQLDPTLSEEATDKKQVDKTMRRLLGNRKRVVVCSHRPVLPLVFKAIGLEPVALSPGGFVVVHRRQGKIVAVETYDD